MSTTPKKPRYPELMETGIMTSFRKPGGVTSVPEIIFLKTFGKVDVYLAQLHRGPGRQLLSHAVFIHRPEHEYVYALVPVSGFQGIIEIDQLSKPNDWLRSSYRYMSDPVISFLRTHAALMS